MKIKILCSILILIFVSVAGNSQINTSDESNFTSQNIDFGLNKKPKKSRRDIPDPFNGNKVYGYAYSASPTEMGGTGLFTVFDAYGIHKGEFRIGVSATRFSRDPSLRITQIPLSFTYGARDWLEVFISTNPYQQVSANAPDKLSGSLLFSALAANSQATNIFTNSVSNGFFLLPGLPVSGATVGGILPGLPGGQSSTVFDPILNRNKNAFTKPRYFNDLPFVGTSGTTYGDTIVGTKLRVLPVGLGDAVVSLISVMGYVKIPSTRPDGLSNPNSNLYRGSSSGTFDFAGFLLYSTYLPYCHFTKQKCSADVLSEPSPTLNTHVNLGFVYNGDPKINGTRLIDRKNAFVSNFGMDAFINRFTQAVGEFKYSHYIGGGTPNLRTSSPADITVGFKFFPLGMPKQDPATNPKDKRLFLSFGIGYRYSFNIAELSGLARNNHGFTFQLSTGKTNGTPKLEKESSLSNCKDNLKFNLTDFKLDKAIANKGEEVFAMAEVDRPEMPLTYVLILKKNGEFFKTISLPITTEALNFVSKPAISFRADFEPGDYQIQWVTTFAFRGRTCQEESKTLDFKITDNQPPILSLIPSWQNPISAKKQQNLAIDAQLKNASPSQLTWKVNPEVPIGGIDLHKTIDFSALQAGKIYTVTAEVPNPNSSLISRQIQLIVNNPPTVTLIAKDQSLPGFDIQGGTPLELQAEGKDEDAQPLKYNWEINGKTYDGKSISIPSNFLYSLGNDTEKIIPTEQLPYGDYTVLVMVDDTLDKSEATSLQFRVVPRTKNVLFAFDIPKRGKLLTSGLNTQARKILDEEVTWLLQSPNRSVEIRCEGYTDNVGGDLYNFELGCRRACAVRNYLISRLIKQQSPSDKPASERIRVMVSFGKIKADPNQQRDEDRRVDLIYTRIIGEASKIPLGSRICDCDNLPIYKRKKDSKRRS